MAKDDIILDEHDHLNKHKDKVDKFLKTKEKRKKEFKEEKKE